MEIHTLSQTDLTRFNRLIKLRVVVVLHVAEVHLLVLSILYPLFSLLNAARTRVNYCVSTSVARKKPDQVAPSVRYINWR